MSGQPSRLAAHVAEQHLLQHGELLAGVRLIEQPIPQHRSIAAP
jgi:hypothetical protein